MALIELTHKGLGWLLTIGGGLLMVAGMFAPDVLLAFLIGMLGGVIGFFGLLFLNDVYKIVGMRY